MYVSCCPLIKILSIADKDTRWELININQADWNKLSQWTQMKTEKFTVPTIVIDWVHDSVSPADNLAVFFGEISNSVRAWANVTKSCHAAYIENTSGQMIISIMN